MSTGTRARIVEAAARLLASGGRETQLLLARLDDAGFEWVKLDNLYLFDGKLAYSLDQGQ